MDQWPFKVRQNFPPRLALVHGWAFPGRLKNDRLKNESVGVSVGRNENYHGVGNFYLINSKILQIGIGIGKFSTINSEKLHIGNFLGDGSLKGDRNRYR